MLASVMRELGGTCTAFKQVKMSENRIMFIFELCYTIVGFCL